MLIGRMIDVGNVIHVIHGLELGLPHFWHFIFFISPQALVTGKQTLEEIPSAIKNIKEVKESEKLAITIYSLTPLPLCQ